MSFLDQDQYYENQQELFEMGFMDGIPESFGETDTTQSNNAAITSQTNQINQENLYPTEAPFYPDSNDWTSWNNSTMTYDTDPNAYGAYYTDYNVPARINAEIEVRPFPDEPRDFQEIIPEVVAELPKVADQTPLSVEESKQSSEIDTHISLQECNWDYDMENVPVPSIQNVVATVDLCCRLRLREISDQTLNSEYNPHRFAALIMRIFEPKSTALIFSTGKMVVTGAKSADLCRLAAKKFAKIIRKLGYNVYFNHFQIQNIVGSVDLGMHVKLEILAASRYAETDYEPELFPGLVYRLPKPRVVILVFISGKIVLTGAKYEQEIQEAFRLVYPIISSFCFNYIRPLPPEESADTEESDTKRIRLE